MAHSTAAIQLEMTPQNAKKDREETFEKFNVRTPHETAGYTSDTIEEGGEATPKVIFEPYSFSDLLSMPPKEWLIEQIFGVGDIGMIYGSPGCGKTFIVIDMIIALCAGRLWSNQFKVFRPLRVAYCAGEGISGLPARFLAAAQHHNIFTLDNFTFYKTIPQLYEDNAINIPSIKQFTYERQMQQKPKGHSLDVLVIDTLHTATTGADENSSQDIGKVLQECRLVATTLGCVVVLVHHTNKGGTSERGSSALRGAMDFVIEIKKQSESGTAFMSCSKLKDGEPWKDKAFTLCKNGDSGSVHVSWNVSSEVRQLGKTEQSKIKLIEHMERFKDQRFSCKALSAVIDQKENYTLKLLNHLVKESKCIQELENPIRAKSSKNPFVFYVQSLRGNDNV